MAHRGEATHSDASHSHPPLEDDGKMNPRDYLGVLVFNVLLLLFNLPVYAVARVTQTVKQFRGGKETVFLTKLTIAACHFMWLLSIKLCWWIRVNYVVDDLKRMETDSGRPKVILANHQSFLDTLFMTSHLPFRRATQVKMYVASTLCKTPLLGTIVLGAGHVEVPFQATKTTDTNMSVDKALLQDRMEVFKNHIRNGGTGSWFPEGRLNREDPNTVGMFRAGGFAIAEETDVEVWGLALVGVTRCWPSRSSVGGRPSHIHSRLFLICESTHDYLREHGVSREQVGDSGEQARTFLADSTRVLIQECCDQMRGKCSVEKVAKSAEGSQKLEG